jgi:histidyl-tRNA synthetase
MSYANARQIPCVAIAGESEMAAEKITLKNMITGEQQLLTVHQLLEVFIS